MNTEHETLARALSDLAGEMPHNHRRVTQVHDRIRRARRHRRAAGGAVMSVAAAGAVAAGVLRPGASTPNEPVATPVASLPACSSVPPPTTEAPPDKTREGAATPAATPQYFKGVGYITAIPSADSVVVKIDEPSDVAGSTITLVTNAGTHIGWGNKDAGHDALQVGQHVALAAHVDATGATVADFIYAGIDAPAPTSDDAAEAKLRAAKAESSVPDIATSNRVKGMGKIEAATASSVTVALESSSWDGSGSITLILGDTTEYYVGSTSCAEPHFESGQEISFAAERAADGAYNAIAVMSS